MVIKRRTGLSGQSSGRDRQGRATLSRPKKRALKKASPARTRTSLLGATIYQPDLKPSPIGQKLLEALES